MVTLYDNNIMALSKIGKVIPALKMSVSSLSCNAMDRTAAIIHQTGKLDLPTCQAGLASVFQELKPLKPFCLARLIRNLLDSESCERFIYTLVCILELYSDYLPSLDSISGEAFTELYKFFQFWRMKAARKELDEAMIELTPQAFVKREKPSPELVSLGERFNLDMTKVVSDFQSLELPLAILSGLLGLAAMFFGDKLVAFFIDPKIFTSSLAKTAKLIKDSQVVWTSFDKTWESIMTFIGSFFGYEYISDKDVKSTEIMTRIGKIRDEFTALKTTCTTDLTKIIQSEVGLAELEKQVAKLEKDIDEIVRTKSSNINFTPYVQTFNAHIKDVRHIIDDSKSSAAGKQIPVVIQIYGAPGLGKSELAKYIIHKLSELEGRQLSVYVRNSATDKFWSGYHHQDCVVYDEFCQDKENIDHKELFGIVTGAQYKLNMADVSDKGRVFTSRYVFLCSNFAYVSDSKTITDIQALNRRRDKLYRLECPEAMDYFEEHHKLPPRDSPIWKPDFSNVVLTEKLVIPQRNRTDWDDVKYVKHNVPVEEIVTFMHVNQCICKQRYEAELQKAAMAKQEYIDRIPVRQALRELPQAVEELTEEEVEHQINRVERLIDHEEALMEMDEYVEELTAEAIKHRITGSNLYLLQGPSGCGKSYLMSNMNYEKAYTLDDIYKEGVLKTPNANYHIEDISITPQRTCDAIDICQRLSDDPLFTGTCVFTANTDMLRQNLISRGEEALEVFYRRCRVITIANKSSLRNIFFKVQTAKDICETLTWDDIYTCHYEDNQKGLQEHNLTLLDAQIKLQYKDRTVTLYACFDSETLEDFNESKAVLLELPSISWEGFQNMSDYTQLADHITPGSMLRAAIHLRHYLNVFKALPRQYAHPAELINLVNGSNLRVPGCTPSAVIKFADFRILLINHKTFVQLQIQTGLQNIPDLKLPVLDPPVNETKVSLWKLVMEFSALIFGATLITRELFGWNQPAPLIKKKKAIKKPKEDYQIDFLIFAPCDQGKTTWQEKSALGKYFTDTDTETFDRFTLSNENYTMSMARNGICFIPSETMLYKRHKHLKIASDDYRKEFYEDLMESLEANPQLQVIRLKEGQYVSSYAKNICSKFYSLFPEYKPINQESRKAAAKKAQFARSQKKLTKIDDVSPGAAAKVQNWRSAGLQNEAKRKVNRAYNHDLAKPESKILTHTDISPRYELPEFRNIVEIDAFSPYHPNNYPYLKELLENDPSQAFKNFTKYVETRKLDLDMYKNEYHFIGMSAEDKDYWREFLEIYMQSYLQPESMSDPQAAQLIPIICKNQVYVMDGDAISQRALMVHGRVGVTTSHGIDNNMLIKIPATGQTFKFTIISNSIDKDICIFEVDKKCESFKDIRTFIRSQKDTEILDGCDAFFLTVHNLNKQVVAQIRSTKVETRKEVKYNDRKRMGYYYGGTLTGFNLPFPSLTEKGHCGSPGVILNTRYQRKIISIHSAGNDTVAFGLPIYKEMFEPMPLIGQCAATKITVLPHQELTPLEEPYNIGEFKVLYELNHNNSAPVKTDIYRSPLQSEMFGDNFQPSILATYDSRNIDQVQIDHVTIDKWARKQPEQLDLDVLDQAVEDWADYFGNLVKSEKLPQYKLTKTEAINRTTYYGSSQPIPRDTSAGYPWKHRPGSSGKKLFIKPRPHKDTILNCIPDDQNGRDLHTAIDKLIDCCRKGERPAVVFSSSAKDEVLKLKKIYPCRTRGFAGAPIDYTIAHRMFYHTAICSLIETRHKSPIKVGIDATGQEWNELWNWLADNSTVGFDADFKDWDASIPKAVMERLHIIYNRIYSANPRAQENTEEDNEVRKWLHSVLWGPLLTLGQLVVQSPGGQVSGQPATTIDNCLAGLILLYYCWLKLAPPHLRNFQSFIDNVRIAVYGDDQAVTVKPECLGFYNLETIKTIAKEHFGMEITSASKDGKIITHKPLEELEFLKRNFIKVGAYYFGKLQEIVFDKMLNWTHTYKRHHFFREQDKVHYEPLTIEASIDSMLLELCLYPSEIYQRVLDHCRDVLYQIGSKKILPNQNTMLEQRGIPHRLFHSTREQKF